MPFTYNAITFLRVQNAPKIIIRGVKAADRIFSRLTFCCFLSLLYVICYFVP